MPEDIKNNSKVVIDMLFNYFSFFCIALSGILINFLIAIYFEPEVLGRFNIVYAVYILLSQLSVGGIHYSMLRYVAICKNQKDLPLIIFSGLFMALLLSSLVAISYYGLIQLLSDQNLSAELSCITFAVIFFSINKVLFNVFNGLKYMRLFAVGQSLRYLLMVGFIIFVCYKNFSSHYLPSAFLFAESLLFCMLFSSLMVFVSHRIELSIHWGKAHLVFGLKSFLVGVFVEVNSRVDVLIMSYFIPAAQIGIYSFAVMFVEGAYQLLVIIRNFVNPKLAQFFNDGHYDELSKLMAFVRKRVYPATGLLLLVILAIYPFIIEYIVQKPAFHQGWWIILILGVGLWMASFFIIFDQILTLGGFPWQQTMYGFCIIGTNIILCLTLTSLFGMIGAAFAMSFATFVLALIYLSIFSIKYMGINLLSYKFLTSRGNNV